MTGRGKNGRLGHSRAAAARRSAAEALERRVLLSGSLSGTAWDDFDGDGVRDEGEPALAGVRVYLDADNDAAFDEAEPSVTTDAQGAYTFADVAAGRHLVRHVVPGDRAATLPGQAAPSITKTIEGINFSENGSNNGGVYYSPSQSSGAVGPDHVVSVVNSSIEWHTKAGAQQKSEGLRSFFSPLGANAAFRPKALFDPHEGRFVVMATEVPGASRILLAVSDDADPNGTWHFAAIDVDIQIEGLATFINFTSVGIDRDAIYVAGEMLNYATAENPVLFRGSRLWIIEKDALYEGIAPVATVHDPAAAAGLPTRQIIQPATVVGEPVPGGGTYLLTTDLGSDDIDVIRVTKPLIGPTFTSQTVSMGDVGDVPDSGFPSSFPGAPQRGTSSVINTFSGQVSSAVWRDGALYAAMSVLPKTGPDAGQTTAHWVRIDASDPANLRLADQGNVGGEELGAGTFTFVPAVAVDGQGNMALSFAASGPGIYPGAYVTGRRADDPAGTVRPATALAAGQDYYVRAFGGGATRWGPHSSAVVDPADGSTFWAFNQYAIARGHNDLEPGRGEDGRWGTRWRSFTLPDAAPGAHRVDLADGQGVPNLDFGNRRTAGTISGSVFHDLDADGIRDEGEAGLAGRTVYLDRNSNGALDGPTSGTQTVAGREWMPQTLSDYDGGGISGRHAFHLVSAVQGTITDLNARLSITHPRVSDLQITLVSQDGTRVPLIARAEAGGANFNNTLLDDEAAKAVDEGPAPYTGGFRPESPLSAFDGLPAAGTWRLEVHDKEAGETGTITAWSLVFTTSRPGELTAVTGDGGTYSFAGVPFGSHTVRQVLPEGWEQTAPADNAAQAAVLSAAAADAAGRDFGSRPAAPPPAAVVGRHVFYNNSFFDGGEPAPNADDDAATAIGKAALLPGQTPSFANVTNFARGINGVFVDVANLPQGVALGLDDFDFGGSGTPLSVAVRRGAGTNGSDRVTLVWPDYDPAGGSAASQAVANGWLRVTVKANANTGLAAPDVFSFGSLIGETDGVPGPDGRLRVNALDVAALKRGLTTTAVGPDNPYDLNRDGRVNALDLAAVKANLTRTLGLAPAPAAAAALAAPSITEELFGPVA